MPYLADMTMDSYKIAFQTWDKVASIYQQNAMNIDLYDNTYKLLRAGNQSLLPAKRQAGQ